jgi:hypothetical protein
MGALGHEGAVAVAAGRKDRPESDPPRLFAIRFTKDKLLKLPKAERELLLRVGLALNDLALFNRVWMSFYYREPKSQLTLEAQANSRSSDTARTPRQAERSLRGVPQIFLEQPRREGLSD